MYVRGMQCIKSLYLYINSPIERVISSSTQERFDKGHKIGKLAQNLFPGGIDCGMEVTNGNQKECRQRTSKAIKDGCKVIYEAAFEFNGVTAIIDMIVKRGSKWDLYEVKSSASVHDYHTNDFCLQYYVINGSGLKINDISIVHIDNSFVRNGEIDCKKLFKIVSVKKQAIEGQADIEANISKFKKILKASNEPTMDIGAHCSDPFECDFHDHCWEHIPEYSVFNLSRIGKKAFEFYQKGIIKLEDIPVGVKLSENQIIERDSHLSQTQYIDKENLKGFIKTLNYPLYFMDFETIWPAIPLYNGTSPFKQIPFQYSVHVVRSKDAEPEHFEFLAEGKEDPRIQFIERLLNDTKGKGSVVAYNMTFEKQRLDEIAMKFPKYKKDIESLISRMVDLMKPFASKHYYHPEMKGSYSLKSVLPAIVPNLSYDSLEIQEGGSASSEFERMLECTDEVEIQKIRKNLLEYCKMDTYAMIAILNKL